MQMNLAGLSCLAVRPLPRCPNHHRPQHAVNTLRIQGWGRLFPPLLTSNPRQVLCSISRRVFCSISQMQCASIYERLAEAIPAKYSPYSNDTLTDRRREGRNYWLAYESKIRTVCSILLSSVPTNLPTAKPHLPGSKSSAAKAIREIFEYSQAIREMSVCKASDPDSCWIGCYGAVKICNCRLASQKCRSE